VGDESPVPRKAEDEGRNENIENEHEKLGEHIGAVFSLDDFLKHLLDTDIFFCININEEPTFEWFGKEIYP